MMKLLRVSALAVAAAFVFSFAASAAEPEFVFKMGFADPETSIFALGGKQIAVEVEKATEGRVVVEVYAGAQLGNEREMIEGAQLGSVDMATAANNVLSAFIPEMLVLDQPFLFDSVKQAHHTIDGKLGELIAEKGRALGLHIVGWLEAGFRNVFSNRPITKLADFEGLKIRTMENRMQIATFNALKAISTPMAVSEQYTALQQGTIDACENATANMKTNRYYEVIKNCTFTNHLYTFIGVVMSDRAYSSLPADLLPKFLEGVRKGVEWERNYLLQANDESVEDLSKNEGVTYHQIDRDSLKAAVAPAVEPFKANMNKDWLKVIEDSKKEVQ